MPSLTLTHTVAPVIGVKRESEAPLINPKRRAEVPDIIEIDNFPDVADGARVQSVAHTSHLEDGARVRSVAQNHRGVNPEAATQYFDRDIEKELAQLDNHIIKWEVARSIFSYPVEDQRKVLASDLPSDPRDLNLTTIVPGCGVDYDYDMQMSTVIDQIKHEMKSEENPTDESPIQRLIRSGDVRFAIDLSLSETGWRSKMTNARLATSNELLRTYGSDCWIQFHLSEAMLFQIQWSGRRIGVGNEMWQFFHRPLRFCHRVYRSALVKDECVWFFTSPMNCPRPMYTTDMIQKQLPLELNPTMKISKFNSRLQLGLSTTTPSIKFNLNQIRRVPDIYTSSLRISKELMSDIATKLGLSYVPSAISGAHKVTEANYVGQKYSWALFDPVGLPGQILLQVWSNDHISNGLIKFFKFQFSIPVYVPSSRRWKDVQCDIVVPRMRIEIRKGKPTDEVMMTDGAAAIGWGAALGIKKALGLSYLPAAYQARILKSKGLWYLSRDLDKDGFWIEIRDSQWKGDVRCKPGDAITFNICNFSTRAKAGHVNRQSIPVIVSRNVPVSVFTDRQREAFKAVLDELTSTNPVHLSQALEVHGHLLNLKAKRLTTTTNSFVRKEVDEVGVTWEKYSNRPCNAMEEIVELLKSGFTARNNRVVDRLNVAGKQICEKMMNFKVEISSSATIYAIPDPTGTLKEGEVFLRLSRFRDPKTSVPVNILKGDCVVARSPCVLPTDARKVKAVTNQRLACYEDVLVCSIQGKKSLLDYLSGGDYDGDVVIVIWDDAFTKNFVNADDKHLLPTEKYNNFFSDTVALAASGRGSGLPTMKVQDFINLKHEHGTFDREFRRAQLVSLFQPVAFGRYSRMYKVCEYLFGISHPLTMKMGYVYTKCLDAAKQGTILKAEADYDLKQEFEEAIGGLKNGVIPLPYWTSYVDISKDEGSREWNTGSRENERHYLPLKKDHVLEAIASTSQEEGHKFLFTLKNLEVDSNDPCLSLPWQEFEKTVKSNLKHAHTLLDFIKSNAEECYDQYQHALYRECSQYKVSSTWKESRPDKFNFEAAGRTFWVDGRFENAVKAVENDRHSLTFLRGKGIIEYNNIRASALAAIAPEQDFFPFHVVFNELCQIRASAAEICFQAQSGIHRIGHCPKSFAPEFWQAMMTKKSLLPPEKSTIL
ncbi:uncharacterized protein PGTG_02834 [Puccinia graminis f. sp. tritici CRL 75-36-700-3]|uniref:RNA-dependent RNA polymerase n=1 Tax=Puccinia graminis f. sp. tritici (strain CRL 75-36-700-3 / race SCCL) TaxID=418459 RepID=E3JWG8_PUCGT|nr:uncharacterized protein PGTG_02834 [Puccinia graminis f. sp. tritici CRL 75-36-700-3]EFP76393.2 hypothetical protein PGTG_02834 [Puccinia graminis f. sp. tritici CRL 75-36-700-3]